MSVELISVLVAVAAVGATLGGLVLTGNRGLRQDMRQDIARLESRLDEKINGLESRLREDMKQFGRPRGTAGAWPSQTGRAAGRIARGHQRTGGGQLGR